MFLWYFRELHTVKVYLPREMSKIELELNSKGEDAITDVEGQRLLFNPRIIGGCIYVIESEVLRMW